MGVQAPVALDSATKYQTLFSNKYGVYCGAEKLIPLNLVDGRSVWLNGLEWSGGLVSGGTTRTTGSVHNAYTGMLVQGTSTLQALQPVVYDSTNTRYFMFDAHTVNGATYARLDPVAALVRATSIVATCRYSNTDFTSWTLAQGPLYAVVLMNKSSISPNVITVTANYALPVVNFGGNNIYFGSTIADFNDGYLYMVGQSLVSGSYNHYLARIPWSFIYDQTHTQYYGSAGWSINSANLTPMITGVGPEVSWWKEGGKYFLLAKMGTTNNTINLFSSSLIGQRYSLAYQATTASSPPSGGWSNGAYLVPGTQLASGKRLGFYSNGIANDTYDKANPQYKSPTFFEF